jgi:hypothetical protein
MPPSHPPRRSARDVGRVLAGALIFTVGLLSAAFFAGASPAAPKDCLPVVGCITTALPTVSLPAITLPTVTVPTLPATTTSDTPAQTTPSSTTQTNSGSTTESTAAAPRPEDQADAPFTARASVRVLGRRARRVVQITARVNKDARVTAVVTRSGRSLMRKEFSAKQGSRVLRLRVRTGTKAGLARLWLTYRTASKEGKKATYRIRLPR